MKELTWKKYKKKEVDFDVFDRFVIYLKEDSGNNTKLAEYGSNYDKTAYEYDKMIVDSCEGKSNVLHVVVRYSQDQRRISVKGGKSNKLKDE